MGSGAASSDWPGLVHVTQGAGRGRLLAERRSGGAADLGVGVWARAEGASLGPRVPQNRGAEVKKALGAFGSLGRRVQAPLGPT